MESKRAYHDRGRTSRTDAMSSTATELSSIWRAMVGVLLFGVLGAAGSFRALRPSFANLHR